MAKAAKPKSKKRTINKSAVTGKIVSGDFAKSHPETTYEQTITQAWEKGKVIKCAPNESE